MPTFFEFRTFSIDIDRFIDFYYYLARFQQVYRDWAENLVGGFSKALNRLAALVFFSKINILCRNDRFDLVDQIDFGRIFRTWSIFNENFDRGVFEGAESIGDISFS